MTEKPLVLIDARMLAVGGTGVSSYARAVVAALQGVGRRHALIDDDESARFGERSAPMRRARRYVRAHVPMPVTLGWRSDRSLGASDVFRLANARFAATGRVLDLRSVEPPGIVHWTYPVPARLIGWRNLYTVHDVSPLTMPGMTQVDGFALRRRLDTLACVAAGFVTVSETSRRRIAEQLGMPLSFIHNAGAAVSALEREDGPLPADLRQGEYYLFCGMPERRKNLDSLIAAWRAAASRRPLVIVGGDRVSTVDQGLIRLPYQPRPRLASLLANARALLFPTLDEGFGLPIIEAMALGTAVLTADRGGAAETAADAALLVDPTDRAAIAEGIRLLDRDDGRITALRNAGRIRSQDFTIEGFGRRLVEMYEMVGASARLG